MPANTAVTESELELMKILWDSNEPLTVSDIMKRLSDKNWKTTTVSTLLTRLCEKGAASFEKNGRSHLYYPVLKKDNYQLIAAKSLLDSVFSGSIKNLVASLYDNDELSGKDIEELKNMFRLD